MRSHGAEATPVSDPNCSCCPVLEPRPRHGYELGKLIETQSGGRLVFHVDSLYPLLYRLEERGRITIRELEW